MLRRFMRSGRHLCRRHGQLRQDHHDQADRRGVVAARRGSYGCGPQRSEPRHRQYPHDRRRRPNSASRNSPAAGQVASGFMTKSLRPQIGVITTVGNDHYKNFRSLEATAQEKSRLVAFLPRRGTAILNADDPHVIAMRDRTRARVITYGLSREADVRAEDVRSAWPGSLEPHRLARTRAPAPADAVGRRILDHIGSRRDRLRHLRKGLTSRPAPQPSRSSSPFSGAHLGALGADGPDLSSSRRKRRRFGRSPHSDDHHAQRARAPRKTMVIGTVSDYSGKGGDTHRKVARLALDVADRVIFVGPHAGHVSQASQARSRSRLVRLRDQLIRPSAFLAETAIAERADPLSRHRSPII